MATPLYKPTRTGDIITFSADYQTKDPASGAIKTYSQDIRLDLTTSTKTLIKLDEGASSVFEVFYDATLANPYQVKMPVARLNDGIIDALGLDRSALASMSTIDLPISSVTMNDCANSKLGSSKGFQITLVGNIKIKAGARGLEVTDASDNILLRDKPVGDITYSPTITQGFVNGVLDGTLTAASIKSVGKSTTTDIKSSITAFSPSFVMALASSVDLDPSTNIGTKTIGGLEILRASVEGYPDYSHISTVKNDLILVKQGSNCYVLHNGAFVKFDPSLSLAHNKKIPLTPELDAGIIFPVSGKPGTSIEVPVIVPTTTRGGSLSAKRTSAPYKQVDKIARFVGIKTTATNPEDVQIGDLVSVPADNQKIATINTEGVKKETYSLDVAEIASPPPPGGGGAGDAGGGAGGGAGGAGGGGATPPATTKKRMLPKILKALGPLAILAGVASLILAVALPAVGVPLIAVGGILAGGGIIANVAGNAIPEETTINEATEALNIATRSYNAKVLSTEQFFANVAEMQKIDDLIASGTLSTKEINKLKEKREKLRSANEETIAKGDPSIIQILKNKHVEIFAQKIKDSAGRDATQEEKDSAAFDFVDDYGYAIARNFRINAGKSSARKAIRDLSIAERYDVQEHNKEIEKHLSDVEAGTVTPSPAILGDATADYLKKTKDRKFLARAVKLYSPSDIVLTTRAPTTAGALNLANWQDNFIDNATKLDMELLAVDSRLADSEKLFDYATNLLTTKSKASAATDVTRVKTDVADAHADISAGTRSRTDTLSDLTTLHDSAEKVESKTKKAKRKASFELKL